MTLTYQAKLSVVSLLTVVVLVGALMLYFHREQWEAFRAEAFQEIIIQQATLSRFLRPLDPEERVSEIQVISATRSSAANTNEIVALVDEDWRVTAGPNGHAFSASTLHRPGQTLFTLVDTDGQVKEAFGVLQPLDAAQNLFVGRWTSPYQARIRETWRVLLVGGVVVAIPLGLMAIFSYRRTLRELETLRSVCESIGAGDLKARLPEQPTLTDLSIAGGYLNQTFDRLEDLVSGLEQLGDNIRHEVAHGVTRIDTRLKALRPLCDANDALRQQIDEIKMECDSISASATSMLALSEIKAGESFSPTVIDLADCAASVIDTLSILAEEKHVEIGSHLEPAQLLGDPKLLQIMISNLVSNAIKYTPSDGTVTISVSQENGTSRLCVEDSGPGIPSHDRADVFVPRRRLTRDRETPGHGYGLAIAKAVAERHAGSIHIEDCDRGARFVVLLSV